MNEEFKVDMRFPAQATVSFFPDPHKPSSQAHTSGARRSVSSKLQRGQSLPGITVDMRMQIGHATSSTTHSSFLSRPTTAAVARRSSSGIGPSISSSILPSSKPARPATTSSLDRRKLSRPLGQVPLRKSLLEEDEGTYRDSLSTGAVDLRMADPAATSLVDRLLAMQAAASQPARQPRPPPETATRPHTASARLSFQRLSKSAQLMRPVVEYVEPRGESAAQPSRPTQSAATSRSQRRPHTASYIGLDSSSSMHAAVTESYDQTCRASERTSDTEAGYFSYSSQSTLFPRYMSCTHVHDENDPEPCERCRLLALRPRPDAKRIGGGYVVFDDGKKTHEYDSNQRSEDDPVRTHAYRSRSARSSIDDQSGRGLRQKSQTGQAEMQAIQEDDQPAAQASYNYSGYPSRGNPGGTPLNDGLTTHARDQLGVDSTMPTSTSASRAPTSSISQQQESSRDTSNQARTKAKTSSDASSKTSVDSTHAYNSATGAETRSSNAPRTDSPAAQNDVSENSQDDGFDRNASHDFVNDDKNRQDDTSDSTHAPPTPGVFGSNSASDPNAARRRKKAPGNAGDDNDNQDTNQATTDLFDSQGNIMRGDGNGNKQRIRRNLKPDQQGPESELEIQSMKITQATALDYLGRYCILSAEQLRQYKIVFNNIDRDHDGCINMQELDFGLKTVNRSLISNQELTYVTEILEVDPAAILNFKLFAVTAALSERVVGLEPMVKRLIEKMDFSSLKVKLQKSKDLFYLLDDHREGFVRLDDLLIELRSGGLTEEHQMLVLQKFSENGKQVIDFLDFLTYIPLFVEIHGNICDNPLDMEQKR